ncbi:MAG: pyrroloquinoline quinone biosynthesis protein PqqB [Planctomycetes bacterium]|jgi:pyrroloquinoline quinone biosynthesis protein B|nr:pyrroloquinoline quinone biosynthesis protein PqqB [Planctomycetota bacterium]MDP6408994.1 MBL fold metallo-hydrolase [Planctomycetota bacterium]
MIRSRLAAAAASALLGACAAAAPAPAGPPSGAYVLVLGTAQDAGLPQIACRKPCCEGARADATRRRLVASVLIVDPRSGSRWLIDATPDLAEQVERARGHGGERTGEGGRPALFEGIFLTHAHLGHVTGLLQLGPEAYASEPVPVHGSARMIAYLESNPPWSLLVERGHIRTLTLAVGEELELAEDLSITAFTVPHRDEFTDTYAYLVRGPRRALLCLPDIDKWGRWERSITELVAEVDVALVDGTFYADGEVAGRSMAEIPHPFIVETMALFAGRPAAERARVRFFHLNHSNPAADPAGEAAAAIEAAGMAVAAEGEIIEL